MTVKIHKTTLSVALQPGGVLSCYLSWFMLQHVNYCVIMLAKDQQIKMPTMKFFLTRRTFLPPNNFFVSYYIL